MTDNPDDPSASTHPRAAQLVDRHERAVELLAAASGEDRGDQLRRQAEALAYRSALAHVAELLRIENTLANSIAADWDLTETDQVHALDIIRSFMSRGLLRANFETGDRANFWVPR